MTKATWYVQRPDGTPLGTVEAEDANVAGLLAATLHGRPAYVFPESHTTELERWLARWKDTQADEAADPDGGD